MAKIVLGFGSSHGPLLSIPPDKWSLRADADRKNPELEYRGEKFTFDQLVEYRKNEKDFLAEIDPEIKKRRDTRNQSALDSLSEIVNEAKPDVIVLVGDDQHEWFNNQVQPAFSMYYNDAVVNTGLDEEQKKHMQPGLAISMSANHPPIDHSYPIEKDLAKLIIDESIQNHFDISVSLEQPTNNKGTIGVGHAVGFVYRRILRDNPIPVVPILINTFYPPNQPTAKRCFDFGRVIGKAIKRYNSDKRVAVCASGGMSHFVVDEKFDEGILKNLMTKDYNSLFLEKDSYFRSGTSEIKNWICAAGILSSTKLLMDIIDYVPCYRSEAGTGSGMAYAVWR